MSYVWHRPQYAPHELSWASAYGSFRACPLRAWTAEMGSEAAGAYIKNCASIRERWNPKGSVVQRSEHKVNTRGGLNIAQLVEIGSVALI